MADYTPILQEADSFTLQASATITGGQVVAITGVGTIGPAGAASTTWVGVAGQDAVSGAYITVYRSGVQLVTASGTVTAGDTVVTAASGQVATGTAPTGDAFVGKALTTATTGNKVRVLFAR